MRASVSVALVILLSVPPTAADDGPIRLDETVITPSRRAGSRFEPSWRVDVVEEEKLSGAGAPRSLPDALAGVPGVMVQKTGYGQASPYLRGLTGFHTLLLVDGIRLNHSAFRSGPNQYLATVDHLSLRRLEVVRGPASVLHGSDAMGGALNLLPRRPPEEVGGAPGGRLFHRHATAEGSHVSRFEAFWRPDADLGLLVGASRKVFGDLHAADGLLRGTGYDEWDADGRFVATLAPETTFTMAFQRVSQDDVPRTHKTIHARSWRGTTVGRERARELDQTRTLLYARLAGAPGNRLVEYVATLSWQRHVETRDRLRTDGRRDRRGFTLDSFGLDLRGVSKLPGATLAYGVDLYRDRVDSFLVEFDGEGSRSSRGIQGPVADDATFDLLGAFLQTEIPLGGDFDLTAGARATRARAHAGDVSDPETGEEIRLRESCGAVVGSARLAWRGTEGLRLDLGVSQGFRAPNLSDLTRFDSARSNELETPAPGLDPEHVLAVELGARVDAGAVRGEVTLFHTELDDLIRRFPTGRTVDGLIEITKANVGDGAVRGAEAGLEVEPVEGLVLFAEGAVVYGKARTYPTSDQRTSREYLDRLPPRQGRVGARWTPIPELTAEVGVRAAARAHRLSTRDEGDTQRIPPGGTPGFAVLDLELTWRVCPGCTVTLGLGNATDVAYRIHGSGQNEPGRNVVFTVELRF